MFADSSGWASALDKDQVHHALAASLTQEACKTQRKVVTTSYVLAELTGLMNSPLRIPRSKQLAFLADLRATPWVEVVFINEALDAAAWHLWEARPDKDWSLVDCASFVVMQQRRLTEALTTDHHFEQAGFVRLLK